MTIKGTETEKNLLKAFAGESQARNRYTLAAKKAKEEGYEQIAGVFMEIAEQELMHATRFFSYLEGGELEITAAYPAGKLGNTAENLKQAAEGENEEWSDLYPEFSAVAKEEGFNEIATQFKMVAKAEVTHEERFLKLLDNLENNLVFERDEPVKWYCRKCGFIHESKKALKNCPTCKHPMAYFEVYNEIK